MNTSASIPFKPLPSLGGTIEERKARSPHAQEIVDRLTNTYAELASEFSLGGDSTEPLTPEQAKNWRQVLFTQIGPYAMIMSVEEIQAIRDKMQELYRE